MSGSRKCLYTVPPPCNFFLFFLFEPSYPSGIPGFYSFILSLINFDCWDPDPSLLWISNDLPCGGLWILSGTTQSSFHMWKAILWWGESGGGGLFLFLSIKWVALNAIQTGLFWIFSDWGVGGGVTWDNDFISSGNYVTMSKWLTYCV